MASTHLKLIKAQASVETETETGPELLKTVVSLTGLPENDVAQELSKILEQNGSASESLTLDELRDALLAYLETLHSEISSGDENAPH